MRKRYYIRFDSDRIVCGSNEHTLCNASTLKSAKAAIRSARKKEYIARHNPRNFRVYDTFADCPEDEHVPCVYQED